MVYLIHVFSDCLLPDTIMTALRSHNLRLLQSRIKHMSMVHTHVNQQVEYECGMTVG